MHALRSYELRRCRSSPMRWVKQLHSLETYQYDLDLSQYPAAWSANSEFLRIGVAFDLLRCVRLR